MAKSKLCCDDAKKAFILLNRMRMANNISVMCNECNTIWGWGIGHKEDEKYDSFYNEVEDKLAKPDISSFIKRLRNKSDGKE